MIFNTSQTLIYILGTIHYCKLEQSFLCGNYYLVINYSTESERSWRNSVFIFVRNLHVQHILLV